jgi:Ca2+-binding EF-hand superfamily protein
MCGDAMCERASGLLLTRFLALPFFVRPRPAAVEDLAALDDDNSGEVSELEFLKHMLVKTNLAKQRDIDVICEQFKALDADGSGFLSAADFEQAAANKEKLRMGTHAVQTVE